MRDRRKLALFITDELAAETDKMMKKYEGDIYISNAKLPPFDEDDLPGILNFFIFEPKQKELEMLMN